MMNENATQDGPATPTASHDNVASPIARQYLRLHLTPDVGPIRLKNLIGALGSADAVLSASMHELQRAEGVGTKVAESIFRGRNEVDVDCEIQRAANHGVRVLCWEDADYPAALRNIPDPPICLFVKGTLQPTDAIALAIVGTRRCSHYGREQAVRFAELLAGAGFTVVSGLARGIDGCAHQGAIRGGGRTIAVLGNGLSTIYPPEHQELAEQIASAGALVSELPVGIAPDSGNFPRRNRIIVGLSLGVIVIEAGKASGALITARLANEYNREAFAVPGRVDQPERTLGVHSLIRDGHAKLVTCLEDVLDELGAVGEVMSRGLESTTTDEGGDGRAVSGLSADEAEVLAGMGDEPVDVESLTGRLALDTAKIMASLTSLQIKARVQRLPTGQFVRRGVTADAPR